MAEDYGLISIIVPVYNVETYLPRCIDSILAQTYKNLEIILVDDGSSDKSGMICDQYAKKDTRISVIHKKNGGLSDARNVGIEMAQGDYIGFIDSDDWITEDMFEILHDNMLCNDADISICQFKFTTSENEKIDISENTIHIYDKHQSVDAMFIGKKFTSHACNKLYKTYLFQNVRFPTGKIYEDQFTIFKLLWDSDKIVCTNKQCYFYFMRENSIAHDKFNTRQFDLLDAIEMNIEFFKKQYPSVVKYIQYYWVDDYLYLLMSAIRQKYDIAEFTARKDKMKQYKKGYIFHAKAGLMMKVAVQLVSINIYCFRMLFRILDRFK